MKLRWLALIFLVALAFFSTVAYAHPGKTDGKGGHINHSTGEYHYHHGYSEHQHYDMDGDGDADCPYSFDDKTINKNNTINKNDSTSKNNTTSKNSSSNTIKNKDKQSNKLTSNDFLKAVPIVVLASFWIYQGIKKANK